MEDHDRIRRWRRRREKHPGLRPGEDDRTLLLARGLGGPGVRGNIVPAPRRFNRKVMREPERIARRELESGAQVAYEAIPEYVDGQLRAVAVHVRITRSGRRGIETVIYDQRLRT